MRKPLPIGVDDFEKVRANGYYYVDKSLMIRDFIEMQDEVALVARPRRFGKTLNMTMLREFFDITKDSREIFKGLRIMETEYANQMNSRPVIYFTFKDCKARDGFELCELLKMEIYREYLRYEKLMHGCWQAGSYEARDFYGIIESLRNPRTPLVRLVSSIRELTVAVRNFYHIAPVLMIDEYDQPIMSSYEYGYHNEVSTFFSNFYGAAMKGNSALGQALITGVQRVVKESIFSQFNNPKVYTVLNKQYARYFGLTSEETENLLKEYGLELDSSVKKKYDGYRIGNVEIYNPWSILNYADNGFLDNYWINTSSNYLVRKALQKADSNFWSIFDQLAEGKEEVVWLTLETSYMERDSNYSLWGLLVNSGYLTVVRRIDANMAVVKIPDDEVMSEFQTMVSEIAGIEKLDLLQMFDALLKKDFERFFKLYQTIVISCTSYMDGKENAYHMLFLGMCITLRGTYKVMSNIEAGYGRSDITLESLTAGYPNIIVEFKQGEKIETLKKEALKQILAHQYYAGLSGETICVGLAHDKKRCAMAYHTITG